MADKTSIDLKDLTVNKDGTISIRNKTLAKSLRSQIEAKRRLSSTNIWCDEKCGAATVAPRQADSVK